MERPRDTSQAAHAAQVERLRKVGPAARLAMAIDPSDAVHELAKAAVRRRHPEYDDAAIIETLIERARRSADDRTVR